MKLVKSLLFVCGGIFGFIQLDAVQKIDIVNDTTSALDVGFSLPEQTIADIKLKKIEHLHTAILSDSAEKIREVVLNGADVNQEREGKTPLFWALILNRQKAFEALLELGAKPDDACVQQAIKMHDVNSVLLLVKNGCKIDFDRYALSNATYSFWGMNTGNTVNLIIRELASRGFNINELWEPAIRLAALSKTEGEDAVRFLLFRGANPNYHFIYNPNDPTFFITPLFLASAGWPNKQVVKMLLDAGANINQKVRVDYKSKELYGLLLCIQERKHLGIQSRDADIERKKIIEILLENGAGL